MDSAHRHRQHAHQVGAFEERRAAAAVRRAACGLERARRSSKPFLQTRSSQRSSARQQCRRPAHGRCRAHGGCADLADGSRVRDVDADRRRSSQRLSATGEARRRSLACNDRRARTRARRRVHRQCRHGDDDRRRRRQRSPSGRRHRPRSGPDGLQPDEEHQRHRPAGTAGRARAMDCSRTTRSALSGRAPSMRSRRWSSALSA